MLTLSVSGVVTRQNFVQSLKALKLSSSKALHLNLGQVDDYALLDVLLFELLVLGTVVAGDNIYHLPTDMVFVEVANTLSNQLQDSLRVTSWLPQKSLKGFDIDRFEISLEVLSPVQVVCNYLDALEWDTLTTNDIIFSSEHRSAKVLSQSRCRELLKNRIADGDISFSLLHALINVLSDQLLKLSSSLFFRFSNLKNMVDHKTACSLRTLLVNKLIKTSVDNTMRSVVSSREAQSLAAETTTATVTLRDAASGSHAATGEAMVRRTEGMIKWDETNHLLILFNSSDAQTITILYRDASKIDQDIVSLMKPQGYMLASRKEALPQLQQLKQEELQALLQRFSRSASLGENVKPDKEYTLTTDNLLKMALIIQRIRAHVPVIVMGETGCGKTSLVRYLAHMCCVKFQPFPIHAGTSSLDIQRAVESAEWTARAENCDFWLFLDEINTCDHLGLLSDIICHHEMNGRPLLRNVIFIAACNPYMLRPTVKSNTAGLELPLAVQHQRQLGSAKNLLYRVHPLPETMMDYVWDYGSLEAKDEEEYIKCILSSKSACKSSIIKAVISAHRFVKENGNTGMVTSLRDVARCLHVMLWWCNYLEPLKHTVCVKHRSKKLNLLQAETQACILSLAVCYESKLANPVVREEFRRQISRLLGREHEWRDHLFNNVLERYQKMVLDTMEKRPEWTAENSALLENVFVIFVSVMNRIPVLVIGKPGSSKSLV